MRTPSALQLLILAHLDSTAPTKLSRYEVMIKINHIFSEIDHPYSPGAFYHAIKRLSQDNMIEINQETVTITSAGGRALKEHLLNSRLPSSFLGISYYILALQLIQDKEVRKSGLHRIEVELIKNNHVAITHPTSGHSSSIESRALKIWQKELSLTLRRIVLELSA